MKRLAAINGYGAIYIEGEPVPGDIGYSIELVEDNEGCQIIRGLASTASMALRLAHSAGGAELELVNGERAAFRVDFFDESTSSLIFEGPVAGLK